MAARIIAQLIVSGGAVFIRAASQAYRQAIINGKKAGVHQGGAASTFRGTKKMDLTEAYDILGVSDKTPWPEVVKKFEHLYGVNERLGSFYLQSKVFRAKERLELELPEEMREKLKMDQEQQEQQHATGGELGGEEKQQQEPPQKEQKGD